MLNSRRGNSFEIANLLCSILIGAGYDAYVCSGYASKSICFDNRGEIDLKMDENDDLSDFCKDSNEAEKVLAPHKFSSFIVEDSFHRASDNKETENTFHSKYDTEISKRNETLVVIFLIFKIRDVMRARSAQKSTRGFARFSKNCFIIKKL